MIKVGITAAERGTSRLLEQGALASVIISTGSLVSARRAEHLLAVALGLPDRITTAAAAHHANAGAVAWEQRGLAGWIARGALIGAISGHMRALLAGKGVPAGQILDVPGGLIGDDRVPLSAAPPLPAAAAKDGFLFAMGRAQPYKGFDDLLDALSLLARQHVRLPHLLLAAVTDGGPTAYQDHLRQRVTGLPLAAMLSTRFDPGLPGLLRHPKLRAVVVPSLIEPLGRIPLEAFAAGAAPVVATSAGGLAGTVIEGVTGYTRRQAMRRPSPVPCVARWLPRARAG